MKTRALCLALAVALFSLPLAAQPTLALLGGKVFTNDPKKPSAEAIAVTGNRITAVGTNDEIRAMIGKKTVVYELGGQLVIPGVNDAHTHPGGEIEAFLMSTDPASTWSDVEIALAGAIDETPSDMWIYGDVGAPVMLDEKIDRAALDKAAKNRKVMLRSFTGHGIILSSAAMKALALTRDVKDPDGGWYGRTKEGDLNGRVYEYAQWALQRRLNATIDRAMLAESLRTFSDQALRYGITSIQAMPIVDDDNFDVAWKESGSPLRVRHIAFPFRTGERPRGNTNGIKWILDGTPIEKGAALRTDYPGAGGKGHMNFKSVKPLIANTDQQLLFHAGGDASVRALFDAMSAARGVDWPVKRTRIEHADGLTPDLAADAKRLGVIAVLNPTHFFARTLYPGEGVGYQRAATLLSDGIPIALGSDGPLNPYLNIMLAVQRPDVPSEALTREQAVAAYTSGSAYAEMREKDKGRLAPGMLADFAVLSQDIFTVGPEQLPETMSVLTVIDGKVAYSDLAAVEPDEPPKTKP